MLISLRSRRLVEPRAEINIAPLLDMVFILLIFFLVTTSFVREQSLRVDRPGARSAEPVRGEPVAVTVRAAGRIEIEGRPVSLSILQGMIARRLRGREAGVLVVADRAVTTDVLVRVLDACRLAGARDLAVATARR